MNDDVLLDRIWRDVILAPRGKEAEVNANEETVAARAETVFALLKILSDSGEQGDLFRDLHLALWAADPRAVATQAVHDFRGGPHPFCLLPKGGGRAAFFPDERRLVVAASGRVFSLVDQSIVAECKVPPKTKFVSVSFDGAVVVATSTSGKIGAFSAVDGSKMWSVDVGAEGPGAVSSPRSGSVLCSAWNGRVMLVDLLTGAISAERNFGGGVREATWSEREGIVLTIGASGDVQGARMLFLNDRLEHTRSALVLPPTYGHAALRPGGGLAAVWGECVGLLDIEHNSVGSFVPMTSVRCVWSPDGKYLACPSGFGVSILDGTTLATVALVRSEPFACASFSTTSRLLAIAERRQTRIFARPWA